MPTFHPEDTIVALSSASGPGARAIVRLSGSQARAIADTFCKTDSLKLTNLHTPLPATLYTFQSPHSYTGQDLVEIHTVSSQPIIEQLLADLLNAGARPAQPGEFTQRAFLAGKLDLTRAEAVHAVIESNTERDLKSSLAQLAGNMARPLDDLRNDLLNLLADVEAALDFVDEDIEFVTSADTLQRIAAGLAQLTNLKRQLQDRTVSGKPIRVALVGKPNAGKSSLFNALAGSARAIVSPIPGTTRDYLTASLTLDGIVVELIDTAGLQDDTDSLDEQAQRLGKHQATQSDVLLWCVESDDGIGVPPVHANVIRIHTKSDLPDQPTDGRPWGWETISTSTVSVNGIDTLKTVLTERIAAYAKSPLAPSQSRCRHHVDAALEALRRAHEHALESDPPELLALALREALEQIGEMVGAVYTNDLLDRIFSRFCIGK